MAEAGLTFLDRPNSYIGRAVPRPNLERLTQGRGQYVSDMVLPRMGHVAFVRSPYAHARIVNIDAVAAKASAGVIAIVTGAELATICTPWVGVLTHLKGLKSAPQHPIAIEKACWQGEAVAAVVARTRAEAEDAAERVKVDYEELPVVTEMETALDPQTPVIHPTLGDNLAWERLHVAGEPDAAFAAADHVVEATFGFGRHTGVTLEPRACLADYNPGDGRLTVYQATQAPHMIQNVLAKHLDLAEHNVRIICKDVGGSFGIKVHVYADEVATAALSKLLRRPVKYVADRIESFVTDIHARDHRVHGRIGIMKDGTITAFEIDDRHRALFDVSSYQCDRGQPGRELHRRAIYLSELSRACARRLPEQERHLPISRRRASRRVFRDRGPGRSRGPQDRHGSGRNPPPQHHSR
jgi:carbon-monoxide dehydrogenase large subunit